MKKFILLILTSFVLFIIPSSAMAQSEEVTIRASLSGCILNITVYPERRLPVVGNWDTILNVEIFDASDSVLVAFPLTTNTSGFASADLCSMNVYPQAGNYTFYIRGFSHLRKKFPNKVTFTLFTNELNLTSDGELLAGETSIIYDNYINTLDLSVLVKFLFTSDYKTDLNQDGKVNSLDISILLKNLFSFGD